MTDTKILTLEEIYNYLRENGGVVKNRDVVRHFKKCLTDPLSKDEARENFKKYVNILAQTKTENGEKYLYLKTKYATSLDVQAVDREMMKSPSGQSIQSSTSEYSMFPAGNKPPPPYRSPPPLKIPSTPSENPLSPSLGWSKSDDGTPSEIPQAPPRRRTMDKQKSQSVGYLHTTNSDSKEDCRSDEVVSVKERTQKFNRLASEEETVSSPRNKQNNKSDKGADECDGASVTSIDPKKCIEWFVMASRGDHQELMKLAKHEPRLVNRKDPFTAYTVLHWGAKHGNSDIIKIFAGTYKVNVNVRTNGGYTPLHIAAHFGHREVYNLLKNVYDADPQIRDYSGHTPSYYLLLKNNEDMKENIHSLKDIKKPSEKELSFLRIGSLNVRVRRTTEAFSNFLGVGGNSVLDVSNERIHKGWGSADNVNQEDIITVQKCHNPKKKSKSQNERLMELQSTPEASKQSTSTFHLTDSDSDTAAGFDSAWKS